MKTHFDKTLTDHSAENRTWIMGLTFASIVMVIGLVILPFLDEMNGEKTQPPPKVIPNQNNPAAYSQLPPLPEPTPTNRDLPTPRNESANTTFTVPNASSRNTEEAETELSLTQVEELTPGIAKDDILPETVDPSELSLLTPTTNSPDSQPIIPAPESNSNSSLIAELNSVPPPPETQSDLEAELMAELETIAPISGEPDLVEPILTGNSNSDPKSSVTESSPSPVFKVVSDDEIDQIANSDTEDTELVSNLVKEIRSPRADPEDEKYNNSLIQKYRKKNPNDPDSNKELTEAMGDYYKQEGTFVQYSEKFPDWAAQYHEIKKTSTGPVLFRP